MSKQRLSPEVLQLLNQLTEKITKFQGNTPEFKHAESHAQDTLKAADTLFYYKSQQIAGEIDDLVDKFNFHGLCQHADRLKTLYTSLFPAGLGKEQTQTRLSIVKFLILSAERPTHNFQQLEDKPIPAKEVESVINWGEYLMEGIELWRMPEDDNSENETSSDLDSDDNSIKEGLIQGNLAKAWSKSTENLTLTSGTTSEKGINSIKSFKSLDGVSSTNSTVYDEYLQAKSELTTLVQNSWFNNASDGKEVRMLPESTICDANFCTDWESYLFRNTVLPVITTNIISEYKVLREVLWQMHEMHHSFCFKMVGNELVVRENVSISSVTPQCFKGFLKYFLPFIHNFNELRDFNDVITTSLFKELFDNEVIVPPHTYQSYNEGIRTILAPIVEEMISMEMIIKKQETTQTLVKLSRDLRHLLKPLLLLVEIHQLCVLDYKIWPPFSCAVHLLSNLRYRLTKTIDKLQHDVYLSLYLESLYKYVLIIESWLCKDSFEDSMDEFIILENILDKSERKSEFQLKILNQKAEKDGLFKIIGTDVLNYGKNIHLLRLLKKLHLVPRNDRKYETLYEEFIERFIGKVSEIFGASPPPAEIDNSTGETRENGEGDFIFPVCPEYCKYPTEMDRLENLVDVSDGFLVAAFSQYIKVQPEEKQVKKNSIYQRLSSITTSFFPALHILDETFQTILRERFSGTRTLVVNTLRQDYQLERHINFLKHIYLFNDDLIFPFYKKIFVQLESNIKWGNSVWLTSHLHDIIVDLYPDIYKFCTVKVNENWHYCRDDPLKSCTLLRINYEIDFPLNLVISKEQLVKYRELFLFILQIKWAMFALNNLRFDEIEPNSAKLRLLKLPSSTTNNKSLKTLQMRLKILRFKLLNTMAKIQHHVFGATLEKHNTTLAKDLEEAVDLDSLVLSHSKYINSLYKDCTDVRDLNSQTYGFFLLVFTIKKFRCMWKNLHTIDDKDLEDCEIIFDKINCNLESLWNNLYEIY